MTQYFFTVGTGGRNYYFKRSGSSGHPHRISKSDFVDATGRTPVNKNKKKNNTIQNSPKKWAVIGINKAGQPKIVYMTRDKDDSKFRVNASSFFANTTDDQDTLSDIANIIHKHHAELSMPPENSPLVIQNSSMPWLSSTQTLPTKLAIVNVPASNLVIPGGGGSRQYYIPITSGGIGSRHECFTAAMLQEAEQKQQADDNRLKDTYKACLKGKCEYVLTVGDVTMSSFNARKAIERAISKYRPTLVDAWRCTTGESQHSFFLHNMVNGSVVTGAQFKDKQLLKSRIKDIMKYIHMAGVTLGGKVDGKTILYRGDPTSSAYSILVGDLSVAELHNPSSGSTSSVLTLQGAPASSNDFDAAIALDTTARDALLQAISVYAP
jgi:hypothetical protein